MCSNFKLNVYTKHALKNKVRKQTKVHSEYINVSPSSHPSLSVTICMSSILLNMSFCCWIQHCALETSKFMNGFLLLFLGCRFWDRALKKCFSRIHRELNAKTEGMYSVWSMESAAERINSFVQHRCLLSFCRWVCSDLFSPQFAFSMFSIAKFISDTFS